MPHGIADDTCHYYDYETRETKNNNNLVTVKLNMVFKIN